MPTDFDDLIAKMEKSLTLIEQTTAKVESLTTVMTGLENQVKEERDAFNLLKAAHDERTNKLVSQRNEVYNEIKGLKTLITTTTREVKSVQTKVKVAQQAEQLQVLQTRQAESFRLLLEKYFYNLRAFPHQREGAVVLAAAKRGLLADEPGLGKTFLATIWTDLVGAAKTLYIVPNDTQENYGREVAKWTCQEMEPSPVGEEPIWTNPRKYPVVWGKMPKASRDIFFDVLAPNSPELNVIINYEAFRSNKALQEKLINIGFDTIICDESHLLKNVTSNTFKAVKRIVTAQNYCPTCSERAGVLVAPNLANKRIESDTSIYGRYANYCRNCDTIEPEVITDDTTGLSNEQEVRHFWQSCKNLLLISGTPILNRPQELFPQLNLINPSMFYSERDFLRTYCELDYYTNKWKWAWGGEARIAREMKEFYIKRTYSEVGVELPQQNIIVHNLELNEQEYPNQLQAIKDFTQQCIVSLENSLGQKSFLTSNLILTTILRKRQLGVWPAAIQFFDSQTGLMWKCDVEESIKLDACIHFDEELNEWVGIIPDAIANGERVNTFSQFRGGNHELKRRCDLAGIRAVVFDGSTSKDIAAKISSNFDKSYLAANPDVEREWDVLLSGYKKGGQGLNFTDITTTIILDEEWNPGKRDQAYRRTQRVGQDKPTTVHILRIENSVDTWMAALIEEKEAMIEGFDTEMKDLAATILEAMRNGEML